MSALDVFEQMTPDQAPAAPRRRRQTPAEAEYRRAAQAIVAPALQPDGVVLTRASSVKVMPVRWLWQDWLAQGKVHLLAGAPGQGKTTIALAFAATVSAGGRWPDGRRCPPGNVLVWSGEDDPADTLVPRLMAMGADLERVHFVEAARIDGELLPFDPARDMLGLHAAADQVGDVRLLVVDPLVSAITGDSHKNTEVRRGMQPLVDLASSMGAAVVGISHLSKGTAGRDPTERVTGSIAFTAVVRVVLLAAKTKGDDGRDRRILVRSKSNIGPDDGGFEYHVEQVEAAPGIETSVVVWGGAVDGTARELLAVAEQDGDDDARAEASDACQLLAAELVSDSWTPADKACKPLRDAGFTKKQIWAASKKLDVIRKKGGMGGGWYWRLPGGADPALEGSKGEGSAEDSEGSNNLERESSESSGRMESSAARSLEAATP
ncbi:AAA family ATPase [Variovorax paradoxus]|uniref:AAA family ATPase n=1 Tax=Variovorax paradoxus TaxID=34073 RepID=A0AA91DGT0_VARPD|nr:AAA family ATPase [Variovorax paradoxus]OAK55024.1 AAA family ATPase [Variovorax paradoxus]